MKVLCLSLYYSPDLSAGSFRTAALVRSLKGENEHISIDVLTSYPSRYHSFSEECSLENRDQNIYIKRVKLPPHSGTMKSQVLSYLSYVKQVLKHVNKNDYDIVYATTSRLFTGTLGAHIASKKRIPLYLDIRDIFVDTIQDVIVGKLKFFLMPILRVVERYTITRANKINIVSNGFYEYFNRRYPKKQFSFISNGIDEAFLDFPENKGRDNFINILYAGNIGEGQGLEKIIPELALRLSDENVKVKVIGEGGIKKQLEASLQKLKVDNVELHPPIKRERLIQEYLKADILLLHLNDYDAFKKVLPSKIFEYAATGKPILAGVSGYAKGFLEEEVENCAVFSPCQVEDAINAFKNLKICYTDRKVFKLKYLRSKLMSELAKDIIALGEK